MKPNNSGWKPLVIIQCYEDRHLTLPRRKSTPPASSVGIDDVVRSRTASPAPKTPATKPPPPPPMPLPDNSNHKLQPVQQNGNAKVNGVNGTNAKTLALNGKINANGSLKRIPTPDYETTNIEALTAKLKLKTHIEETAEVDSIESYKMKNPPSPQPKPPSNYFMRPPNGTATMKKTGRPVSVTIGEYPSRTLRKEPSKLEFLNGESKMNGESGKDAVPISSRLHSELAMTLSRSNLRKKTEPLAKKLETNTTISINSAGDDSDQNFHKRYGNNILPTSPQVSIPKVPIVKTNSHPISQHIATLAKRVGEGRKDGILKEATVRHENRKKISFDQAMVAIGDHCSNVKS